MAPSPLFNGCHRRDGIVTLKGPSIRAGVRLAPHDIVDLAPTILYLLGYPVPAEMDGKVLAEALPAGYLEEHPIQFTEAAWTMTEDDSGFSPSEAAAVAERLKQLGYL